MVPPLPLRVFVASPGDVGSERGLIRECVARHNARHEGTASTTFEAVGWESVRGTARRPQDAINELIDECHFMVVLFKGRWGSEPGSPWRFTSGTEEELFTALMALGQAEHPMRDVWIAFLDAPDPAVNVVGLRDQLIQQHAMLFESISDENDLVSKFTHRLAGWASGTAVKVPRHVDLIPTSGKDIMRPARLRYEGDQLVRMGQPDHGREKLRAASELGGPPEHLAYAQLLAREGELTQAEAEVQKAIDHFTSGPGTLDSTPAAEAMVQQAGLMRRQGRPRDAIGRFENALTLFRGSSSYEIRLKARVLDQLGLAEQAVGDLIRAADHLSRALELRQQENDPILIAQSLVNLARLDLAAGRPDQAHERSRESLALLADTPSTHLTANAHVLAVEVLLPRGEVTRAIAHAEAAVSLNEQLGNRRGSAIAHGCAARAFAADEQKDLAMYHAKASLDLNEAMGDAQGQAIARSLLIKINP